LNWILLFGPLYYFIEDCRIFFFTSGNNFHETTIGITRDFRHRTLFRLGSSEKLKRPPINIWLIKSFRIENFISLTIITLNVICKVSTFEFDHVIHVTL